MSSNDYKELISKFIDKYGEDELAGYLDVRLSTPERTLTLIGNNGTHKIPPEFLHGEVFAVTSGSLQLGTKEEIHAEYKEALARLIEKLKEKPWRKVYFVPTGPTTLVLQIKVVVYNILRISTVDLFYSKGHYMELDMDYREILDSIKNS
ncbi:hypothetical protein [Candidatus Thiodiazotropha endoloripes]|uniref:SMODS-associated and fused to various effectors domain-containing protein n=1 Tax=Candidatus Thiodiazotropha endoloripes TaxID=1818881 RepID=A0A1E2UTD7_9GAMM|nr:hypothetical protein [Candidatus Thiodiazotropha endoloripes]MCG7983772.1 hypothetical protein [Candidatus Thiodiazotropha lotti]ODB98027.1 hypothetical protein A3196_15435 [Candidatus Thiodiazotropha endoloripes]